MNGNPLQGREIRLSGMKNKCQEDLDHRFTMKCDNLTDKSEHGIHRFRLIRK